MKRRMAAAKGAGKPAKPEGKFEVKDPALFSGNKNQPKKTESDVMTPGKRPKGPKERLRNVRI